MMVALVESAASLCIVFHFEEMPDYLVALQTRNSSSVILYLNFSSKVANRGQFGLKQ